MTPFFGLLTRCHCAGNNCYMYLLFVVCVENKWYLGQNNTVFYKDEKIKQLEQSEKNTQVKPTYNTSENVLRV